MEVFLPLIIGNFPAFLGRDAPDRPEGGAFRGTKKAILISTVAAALTASVCIDAASAGRIADRQVRQQERIQQGIHSGEVNRREAVRLGKEQIRIQHSKRKAWRDGRLSPRERVKIERKQDRASRHIYRARHNSR